MTVLLLFIFMVFASNCHGAVYPFNCREIYFRKGPVCGTDGISYKTLCHFAIVKSHKQNLGLLMMGPCTNNYWYSDLTKEHNPLNLPNIYSSQSTKHRHHKQNKKCFDSVLNMFHSAFSKIFGSEKKKDLVAFNIWNKNNEHKHMKKEDQFTNLDAEPHIQLDIESDIEPTVETNIDLDTESDNSDDIAIIDKPNYEDSSDNYDDGGWDGYDDGSGGDSGFDGEEGGGDGGGNGDDDGDDDGASEIPNKHHNRNTHYKPNKHHKPNKSRNPKKPKCCNKGKPIKIQNQNKNQNNIINSDFDIDIDNNNENTNIIERGSCKC